MVWGGGGGGLKENPQTPAPLLGQLFHGGPQEAGYPHAPSQLMLPPLPTLFVSPSPTPEPKSHLQPPRDTQFLRPRMQGWDGTHTPPPRQGVPKPRPAIAAHPTPHSVTIHPKITVLVPAHPAQFSRTDPSRLNGPGPRPGPNPGSRRSGAGGAEAPRPPGLPLPAELFPCCRQREREGNPGWAMGFNLIL